MKKTTDRKTGPSLLTVSKTPSKAFSQSSSVLNANTPAKSKGRTWADVVNTPPPTKNSQVASRTLKGSPSDLSHHANIIATSEADSPARSRSDSGYSFQSLQTITGDVGFNTQILLTIDPEKKENQVSLYFTSLRPKTILGAAQGHHVISHRLILELCSKIAMNSRLVDIPEKIKRAFERTIPGIEDRAAENGLTYPSVPDTESYPRCDLRMSNMLEELGPDHKEAYETGMRQKRVNRVVCYLSDMLAYYNALPDVTHARTKGGGINQGLEHSTIVALNAVSYFLALGDPATSDQKQEFYRQALEKK